MGVLGIQVWDIASVDTPEMINYLEIEGGLYPDAYTRVVLSVFATPVALRGCCRQWRLLILNTENPREPELVHQHEFDVPLRAAGVFAIGNLLLVTSAEGPAQSFSTFQTQPCHSPSQVDGLMPPTAPELPMRHTTPIWLGLGHSLPEKKTAVA